MLLFIYIFSKIKYTSQYLLFELGTCIPAGDYIVIVIVILIVIELDIHIHIDIVIVIDC